MVSIRTPGAARQGSDQTGSTTGKKAKETSASKSERLRALRLAHEATRREAGVWGDMTVGEIFHQASNSVFMQLWRGQRRPNPFEEGGARRAGASSADWKAMLEWISERNTPDFSQRIIAWDLSAAAAREILKARIEKHEAAGVHVTNPLDAPK
jgi:hypothetical protein